MTTTLNASTAGAGGFIATSDNSGVLALQTAGTTAITVDASQNVGIGVTPSAWTSTFKALQIGASTAVSNYGTNEASFTANAYYATSQWRYINKDIAMRYVMNSGGHQFQLGASGTAGNAIGFTTAMALDSNGNLGLGGSPESSTQRLYVQGNKSAEGSSSNDGFIKFIGTSGVSAAQFMRIDAGNYSGTACGFSIGRNSSNSRSINTGGTVNASGADYAEYMTKAGSFTVAKGDVVGINAQGKLTNIFSEAIAFVVKSTDPSYVGGDTWGIELEGNELEIARQTVDRIAFSGQVPVNVTGATAGQYIIPVNDNGAIKGQAVSNPTFEQYQIAVGKVITIESDGRAKIIVKVA